MSAVIASDDYDLLSDLRLSGANLRLIEDLCPELLRAYKSLPAPARVHKSVAIERRSNRTASWIRGARGERWGYMAANVIYQIERSLRPNIPTVTAINVRELVMIWRIFHVNHGSDYPLCAQRIFALWQALGDGTVHERLCRCGRPFICAVDTSPIACPWCSEGIDLRGLHLPRTAANDVTTANSRNKLIASPA